MTVRNSVEKVRLRRGLSAAEVARRVGVSRQAIYSIESGSYVPNTAVALQLAKVLEVSVEELFFTDTPEEPSAPLKTWLIAPAAAGNAQPVKLARVGRRIVGVPAHPEIVLPKVDATIAPSSRGSGFAWAHSISGQPDWSSRIVIAGCDPALSLLAHELERVARIELLTVSCSSRQALRYLSEGKVHIAGSHLRDPETGDFNLHMVHALFGPEKCRVVTFAGWEEGLLVRKGNPKRIKGLADLSREDLRMVNREPGSGSRLLLDRKLKEAGIPRRKVNGYSITAGGHLEAAHMVVKGTVDCCLAVRSAAKAFDLDFIPVDAERFDLVIPKNVLASAAVCTLLDLLNRSSLRRKLDVLAGYDTSQTGAVQK